MKFRLPEENSAGIGIAGQWFPADFGVVDIPGEIVVDNAEDIAAHGLVPEPVVVEAAAEEERPADEADEAEAEESGGGATAEPKRRGRPKKDA